MNTLRFLLVLCALATVSWACKAPINTCVTCVNHNTTLPLVPYIPGDNFCAATLNTEAVLIEFYFALGGPNWINHTNWLSGDYCTWFGIVCDQNNAVVTIDLHSNNLVGNQLPPSIGCLTFLKSLVLDNNFISGQLPQNFCKLINIQYITIPSNNIGGYIPACFKDLVFLHYLYLFNNGLIGELPDFSLYTSIKGIQVQNNCLQGQVPQNLTSTVIISLDFSNNFFSGCIPDFYQDLVVDFSGNPSFCTQAYIPCFLSAAVLGCSTTLQRVNVPGPFAFCPGSACLSISG